jgi:putative addiction module killer protein
VHFNAHLKIGQDVEYDLVLTQEFKIWLEAEPIGIRRRIKARLDNVLIGHFGLHKRFDGLFELKWHNGIRVYFFIWKSTVIVVLKGGNKNGQS